MANNYKYILFDWDGTLAKTLDVWLSSYKEVAGSLNIDLSKYSDREVVEIFFGKQGEGYKKFDIENIDEVYEKVKSVVDIKVQNVDSYDNVAKVLEELKNRGIKMALHTTSNRNLLYPAINNLDFEKYFEIILTKDDVVNPKPDPEVIEKELEYLGALKEECLIVGDSDKDIVTGKNSAVDTCLYYPKENEKFYRKEFLEKDNPDYVISDLNDLLNLVA
ncbi:MAG: HAD-IA family hydrolase [Microgenomates group bacterium]